MRKWMAAAALAAIGELAAAAPAADSPAVLAELAASADLVALVRVAETDYRRQRDIPVSGSAYLQVLIAYKGEPPADGLVEVYEQGLRAGECYFPTPELSREGRRYIVFLRHDPEQSDRYRGLPPGCAVDVLVADDNRYAVRLPVTGVAFADDLAPLSRPMSFSDPYSLVEDEDLDPALRESMRSAGLVEPADPAEPGRRWRYTSGIEVTAFRNLLGLGEKDP